LADAPLSACGRGGQGFNTGDGSNGKHCFMCILATKKEKKKKNNSLSKKEHPVNTKMGIITAYTNSRIHYNRENKTIFKSG